MYPRDALMETLNLAMTQLRELPRTRETALVGTKIEEAALWLQQHMTVEDNKNG
jgi:hypothetical protein